MGVIAGDVRNEVEGVILSPYLRNMVTSPVWDLACESDSGAGEVIAGADGHKAMFFSSPAWIPGADRFEKIEEFDARIRADHLAALARSEFDQPYACGIFFTKGNYGS